MNPFPKSFIIPFPAGSQKSSPFSDLKLEPGQTQQCITEEFTRNPVSQLYVMYKGTAVAALDVESRCFVPDVGITYLRANLIFN